MARHGACADDAEVVDQVPRYDKPSLPKYGAYKPA